MQSVLIFWHAGALSAAENWQRRDAGRTAWADGAQQVCGRMHCSSMMPGSHIER